MNPVVAPAANDDVARVPDDMRWPSFAASIPLEEQLATARSEYHRYVNANKERPLRERGRNSMRPETFERERRIRLAIYHSLLQLKGHQEQSA